MTQKEQLKDLLFNVHVFSGIVESLEIHTQGFRNVFTQRQKQKYNLMQNALNAMLSELKRGDKVVDSNMDNLGGDMLDLIYEKFRPEFEKLEAIKKL
tara:strand:- start:7071 stop:7361 length:291 start_codon:yes stop_codon:yes gene_type:complete